MDIFHFNDFKPQGLPEAVITIGNFDGVHLGHQALIRHTVAEAKKLGVSSALLTFQPHPQVVLRPDPVPVISSRHLRLRVFESLGLNSAYFIPFTTELAKLEPETFVFDYLLSRFRIRKLIIGFDFHFGRKRAGNAELLGEISRKHGFAFEVFAEIMLKGEKVSSTMVRKALAGGDFKCAERLLGRPFSVLEPVVEGDKRGRTLGFPTLNQLTEGALPLPHGVYASRACLGGAWYQGVSNYGLRPTVGGEKPVLETHLFDFTGDAYGELVEIVPLKQLRGERTFESLDALKAQIARDSEQARDYLGDFRRK